MLLMVNPQGYDPKRVPWYLRIPLEILLVVLIWSAAFAAVGGLLYLLSVPFFGWWLS